MLIAAILSLLCLACDERAQIAQRDRPAASDVPEVRGFKPFADASSVRLFVERGYDKQGNPMFTKSRGLLLSKDQRSKFEATLHSRKIPEAVIGCFIPHHFFKYYDKNDKEIGEFEVCFCCGGIRTNGASGIVIPSGHELSLDYKALESLIKALGEPTDILCDGLE